MNLTDNPSNVGEKPPIAATKIAGGHLRSFYDSILDIFFPSLCIKCGGNINGRETVCLPCLESIPVNKSLFCGSCGARLPAVALALPKPSAKRRSAKVGLPYGKKICHFDFPYILGAATTYKNETARGLVRELKFGFIKNAARPLAKLLISYFESTGFTGDDFVVVPIPLGAKRLRRRGFNQAALIAEIFAEHFSLTVEKEGFVRQKETKPQSEMENFESRFENARNCFRVTAPEKFSGRNIILIDDVSTSGVTFLEAADSLKKSGAKKIVALAAVKG